MLVTVNRVVVPEYEITKEAAQVDVRGVDERQNEAARQLVVRELLRQRADALGFDTEGDLDAALDAVLEQEVQIPAIDDDQCRRYFDANRERFRTPERVTVRHILIPAAPDDVEGRAEAEQRADELAASLQEAPELFDQYARAHSSCPSANEGGHMGRIERGQTVPEFEDVALRLGVGLAARPVETRYGFHVVEVLDREGGEPLDYEDVKDMIADYVRERSWRRAVSQYIGHLAAESDIQGVDLEVEDSPLIQ